MEDNEVIDETAFLLRSPENARRLLESIEEIEKSSIKEVSINLPFVQSKLSMVFFKLLSI